MIIQFIFDANDVLFRRKVCMIIQNENIEKVNTIIESNRTIAKNENNISCKESLLNIMR